MKILKSIATIFSLSLLAVVLTACQPATVEEKPTADDSNVFPKKQAACIYKDGSCCQGEQGICQTVQVNCEEGKEPLIKGCNEKCEAIFECVTSGESEANTPDDNISDSDEAPPALACQNLCGDGVCQEIVCLSIGCPCAETAESCPQDCIENDETDS